MRKNAPILLTLLLIGVLIPCLQAATSTTTIGCINQTVPCSGHGKCTRNSVCLCELYYTGDNCEIVIGSSDRKKINKGGLGTGALIAIIIGIIGFIMFSIGAFAYAFLRLKKTDSRWTRKRKEMLGVLPNVPTQLNIGELDQTQSPEALRGTEISHLNQNISRVYKPDFQDQDISGNVLPEGTGFETELRDTIPETRDYIGSIPEVRLKRFDTIQSEQVEDLGTIKAPLADDLFARIGGFQMQPLNTMAQYHREAQDFVMRNDPISDIPGHIAMNVLYSPDENVRDDHVGLTIASPIRNRKTLGILDMNSPEMGGSVMGKRRINL